MESFLLKMFSLSGIDQVDLKSNLPKKPKFMVIFFFTLCVCLMICQYVWYEIFYYRASKMDIIQFNTPIVIHMVILIDAFIKRKTHAKIRIKLEEIHSDLSIIIRSRPCISESLKNYFAILNVACLLTDYMIIFWLRDLPTILTVIVVGFAMIFNRLNDFQFDFVHLSLMKSCKLSMKSCTKKLQSEMCRFSKKFY